MAIGATTARWTGSMPPNASEKGLLIRRALDLMGALKLGVHIGLDEIRADEFCAMLIIAEERDLLEREKLPGPGEWHREVNASVPTIR